MSEIIKGFFSWAWGLITGIQGLCNWLFTPLQTISSLVGFDVTPIGLIGVTAITIGIIRAIIGVI